MNQKSLDKKKTSELFEGAGSSLHQAFVEAVERDKNKTKELDWEKVAFLFHNTYEGLAPKFGYETRKDTKAFDTKSQNGQLMIATCKSVVSHFLTQQRTELLEEINKLLIGELVIVKTKEPYYYQNKQPIPKEQYEFLLEQRQKLINLLNKKDE